MKPSITRGGMVSPADTAWGSAGERQAWVTIEKLLIKIDQTLEEAGVPWLIVWQATSDPNYEVIRREKLKEIMDRQGLPFLDLTTDFSEDYSRNNRFHTIRGDGHWNEDGHRVAGDSLAGWLLTKIENGSLAWNSTSD